MPTTPRSQLPYPAAADPADVPADMQKLALALDEIAYGEILADVNIPAAVEATALEFLTAGAITYQNVPIVIEFVSPSVVLQGAAGARLDFDLWDAGTMIGTIAEIVNNDPVPSPGKTVPMHGVRRLLPTAGSHTYRIRGYATAGTGIVHAGTGPSAYGPSFIRVRRA